MTATLDITQGIFIETEEELKARVQVYIESLKHKGNQIDPTTLQIINPTTNKVELVLSGEFKDKIEADVFALLLENNIPYKVKTAEDIDPNSDENMTLHFAKEYTEVILDAKQLLNNALATLALLKAREISQMVTLDELYEHGTQLNRIVCCCELLYDILSNLKNIDAVHTGLSKITKIMVKDKD